ncbi:DUF2892 domain-containing protein [Rhodovulum sulfidophilum]|uniref:DUF2892 domain-containing protein n=1 Tax=Rhodovulum sulfidophilum TaxID=35806 RepID=A0ABS1RRH2_RHOSU|nr:DUF2892 domain-containing protein [Rhodovulum sulfidophilum]MBL3550829.1 DUF2892 domain-containing protein [Rhodovulum sulfidophilum]MBL3561401.1 DUF2892 domain-containing protein [Rhodovulum sulfidophilum]MBL3574923.1 DUF2892 domain-containing protein [Rhodovulum sulfidophilum]MBL3584509.1 DUF2892 domain-containing protein [Rhodovulum sulfidophilum]MBL3595424.1 DUF2892 domain-containing protein [Rhodovulum sulfidophilum]
MLAKNVGGIDRALRIIIGALMVIAALVGYSNWLLIGIVPLATGLMSSCPLYSLIGVNTCKKD